MANSLTSLSGKKTMTVAAREFRGYFNNPAVYIVLVAATFFVALLFWVSFFLVGRTSVREMFGYMSWSLMFAAPALTMGLLAEEKRSGTLEILITMPLREMEVIGGKYLAALGVLGVFLLCTLPIPISVSTLGDLDWGPVLAGYLGVFLEGAALMAIGLAVSSFTDSQLVALFVSFAIAIVLVILITALLPFIPTGLTSFAEWLSFQRHTEAMARGVIDTRDVIFFLSIAGFALMVAFRALESRRWS